MKSKKSILLFTVAFILFVNTQAQNGYEKSIETGYSLGIGDVNNNTFNIAMVNGYRVNHNLYLGVGVGFGYANNLNGIMIDPYYTEYRKGLSLIPIFAQGRLNLTESKTSPFILANVGYTIDGRKDFGFMFAPAFGIDFKIEDNQIMYAMVGFNIQNHKYSYTRIISTYDWEITTKEENLTALDVRVGLKF